MREVEDTKVVVLAGASQAELDSQREKYRSEGWHPVGSGIKGRDGDLLWTVFTMGKAANHA